jgi:hypothetical protein
VVTLLYYINHKASVFTQINHIFPVRGHSYIPPDRVIGRIEQVLRKKKTILSPNRYLKFLRIFALLMHMVKISKYMTLEVQSIQLTKIDFKSTEQKMYSYIKSKRLSIRVSKTYAAAYDEFEVRDILI